MAGFSGASVGWRLNSSRSVSCLEEELVRWLFLFFDEAVLLADRGHNDNDHKGYDV